MASYDNKMIIWFDGILISEVQFICSMLFASISLFSYTYSNNYLIELIRNLLSITARQYSTTIFSQIQLTKLSFPYTVFSLFLKVDNCIDLFYFFKDKYTIYIELSTIRQK